MRIEFSFDDGCLGDQRAAALLEKYGFRGIFYYPNNPVVADSYLSIKEIAAIGKAGHEIGGHTHSHPLDMKLLNDEDLEYEIGANKALIEYVIFRRQRQATKFCYPRGRHDERVREAVKRAGYKEARTTVVLKTDLPEDPFQTPTTIHMFPREEYKGVPWLELAKKYFLIALEKGDKGYFHLWGHTNELDRHQEWKKFEELLAFIKERI